MTLRDKYDALGEDLLALYDKAKALRLPNAGGGDWRPTRFLADVRRAIDTGDGWPLVKLVTDYVRKPRTPGRDRLVDAGHAEDTVEALILDESKPYHDLFRARTRRLAAQRIGRE